MIRAQVSDSFLFAWDRIAIRFDVSDADMLVPRQYGRLVPDEHGGAVLEYGPPEEVPGSAVPGAAPTMSLTEAEGRALLEALAAHFGGSGPAQAAREDLLHERKRVDKLTDALIFVATTPPPVTALAEARTFP